MIRTEDIVEIGKFQKTHALRGELNALLDVQEDFLEEGKPLVVVVDAIPVPFYCQSVRPKGQTSFLIKLEGVDTQEEAAAFVNQPIYALRSDLLEYFGEEGEALLSYDDLIGYTVEDSDLGPIGEIVDIDDQTDNELLVVRRPDGETVYIPLTDDFMLEMDDDERRILMRLPDGLLDLNK